MSKRYRIIQDEITQQCKVYNNWKHEVVGWGFSLQEAKDWIKAHS